MREIKFRGMDIQGRWFIGNLAVVPENNRSHKAGHYISNSAGMPFAYQVRPETVGQLTGIKDKNGVMIYEGDVVQWTDADNDLTFVGKVGFRSGTFCIIGKGVVGYRWYDYELVVLGNIYEHRHLLEEETA